MNFVALNIFVLSVSCALKRLFVASRNDSLSKAALGSLVAERRPGSMNIGILTGHFGDYLDTQVANDDHIA